MVHPSFVSFSAPSSFRQNRRLLPLSLACWTEKGNSGHWSLSPGGHEETRLSVRFPIKLCYWLMRVSTTKFWFKPFSLFMSKEMFCYCGQTLMKFLLFLFSRESPMQPCCAAPYGANLEVFIVLSILHHRVKSIKSYTMKIGSVPPLTFTVRWLTGFCFVANYKTCPLSRGETIKSHNLAKNTFPADFKCHSSHQAVRHPQQGNNPPEILEK